MQCHLKIFLIKNNISLLISFLIFLTFSYHGITIISNATYNNWTQYGNVLNIRIIYMHNASRCEYTGKVLPIIYINVLISNINFKIPYSCIYADDLPITIIYRLPIE